MTITICICGAGTMGSGIAQVAAQSGFNTILFDINSSVLESARQNIANNLDYLVNKKKISAAEKLVATGRIKFTTSISDCVAQVIIEAIAENELAKVSLFNQLAEFNYEDTILASNTSSLSITTIQKQIRFPQRVIGMHFFNPAYIMKLVEVVQGELTDPGIARAISDICVDMGKVPVTCKDAPGFIVNRVARHYYLESLKTAEDGIASFQDIDALLEASGFKMGPFKLMDLIGMDINLSVSESLYKAFDETKRFLPSKLQRQKVRKGELGKKSGRGFYDYE
ncbi:MAG: 3-hydroxyacyl-CoA dehydrogenase NAD-binding domain-containing protein [Ginsengibacter sp.]